MSRSIKHGVNPSILRCACCGKEIGLGLFGRMKGDAEALQYYMDGSVCDECKAVIENGGIFFIEVIDESAHNQDPYRTGRLCAIKNETASHICRPGTYSKLNYTPASVFEKIFGDALREKQNEAI